MERGSPKFKERKEGRENVDLDTLRKKTKILVRIVVFLDSEINISQIQIKKC